MGYKIAEWFLRAVAIAFWVASVLMLGGGISRHIPASTAVYGILMSSIQGVIFWVIANTVPELKKLAAATKKLQESTERLRAVIRREV